MYTLHLPPLFLVDVLLLLGLVVLAVIIIIIVVVVCELRAVATWGLFACGSKEGMSDDILALCVCVSSAVQLLSPAAPTFLVISFRSSVPFFSFDSPLPPMLSMMISLRVSVNLISDLPFVLSSWNLEFM